VIAVLGGLADVERDLIRTRTAEGRSRAQKRGQRMGRKPKLTEAQQAKARKRRAAHSLNAKGNFCPRLSWSSRRLVRGHDCPMVRLEGEWSAG
jgi:DNA invertase Pin-like site-specific DNA recombinase